jgi:hypothetical protein
MHLSKKSLYKFDCPFMNIPNCYIFVGLLSQVIGILAPVIVISIGSIAQNS